MAGVECPSAASCNTSRSRVVNVSFPVSALAVTPADVDGTGKPKVEPGAYQVQVGNLTADFSVSS